MGVHDQRRVRNNDERKVRIMKNQITRSMANLIHFFEFLNDNPELISKFDKDIGELIGPKSYYGNKLYILSRLIDALLGYEVRFKKFDDLDDSFIFRYRLLQTLQMCINRKVQSVLEKSKKYEERLERLILLDMERADVWVNYIDR
jgi:hypothetical protein